MPLQDRIDKIAQRTLTPAVPAAPVAPVIVSPAAPAPERPKPVAPMRDSLVDLKARILRKLIAGMDQKMDNAPPEEMRRYIKEQFILNLEAEQVILGRAEREQMLEQLIADITGYGPLEPYLKDNTIEEIMVNGTESLFIERGGIIEEVPTSFESEQHVLRIIDRIVSPLGRRVDESQPFVDARLPDGSRVNVIIPPLALNGPTITIRKFAKVPFTVADLIQRGSFTSEFIEFVKACVEAELNTVISGGTGTGKTTLLNVISSFIPPKERVITIEDAAELQLRQRHVISLEARPKNIEGKGEVTRGDLVVNALRMRPDRIIIGECRSGEALDMLQAMNTGHEGSMTTVHANSPRDALHRLETMVLMAGYDLPLRAIREQISSALDLIIHLDRMRDGTRKVVSVVEIQGMEADIIVTQEIFKFEMTAQKDGAVLGKLRPTGIRPGFMAKLEAAGIFLPPTIFGVDPRLFHS
jgi:pilus assembly protein CpaF